MMRNKSQSMTKAEARELTEEYRRGESDQWEALLVLFESDAHGLLGYTNWAYYCEAEFGYGYADSYRRLRAAEVVRALISLHLDTEGLNESKARTLRKVLRLHGDEGLRKLAEAALREAAGWATIPAIRLSDLAFELFGDPPRRPGGTSGRQMELLLIGPTLLEATRKLAGMLAFRDRHEEISDAWKRFSEAERRDVRYLIGVTRDLMDQLEGALDDG